MAAMPAPSKPEFPPLLEPGLHPFTIAQLRQRCVHDFPDSATRATIMAGLEYVVAELSSKGVTGEVWVNGSFLTEKVDPADVDLVLRAPAALVDDGTAAQREAVEWVASNLKADHLCDSYVCLEYPEGHPLHDVGVETREYWARLFGHSRRGEPKGIAVLPLPARIT